MATYTIYSADLSASRKASARVVTPFTTERKLATFMMDAWSMGMMPLDCIGDVLKAVKPSLYKEFTEEEIPAEDVGMAGGSAACAPTTTKETTPWEDLELTSDDIIEVRNAIVEAFGTAAHLAAFFEHIATAKRHRYLCLCAGQSTHVEHMIKCVDAQGLAFPEDEEDEDEGDENEEDEEGDGDDL